MLLQLLSVLGILAVLFISPVVGANCMTEEENERWGFYFVTRPWRKGGKYYKK
jgi:hypothetical protein